MDQKNTYSYIRDQDELEETLSFCDLSLENQELHHEFLSSHHHSPSSPSHEHFEFPFIPNNSTKNDIVFCGKLIKEQGLDGDGDDQSRYLFPLSSARLSNNKKKDLGSLSFVDSKRNSSSSSTKNFRSQSSSFSSRKHKVLIGVAKITPMMELSDIKKRQSRRNPSPMVPPMAPGDLEAVAAGGRRGHHWGLLKPLRCRGHLVSALARATLGCIPHV
ncbi:hypothetical protein DITRI_Ditri09bG0111200 [Diplodiscus trichospermus]